MLAYGLRVIYHNWVVLKFKKSKFRTDELLLQGSEAKAGILAWSLKHSLPFTY